MTDTVNFELSPSFVNRILNNEFGMPNLAYADYSVYAGLGIEFDENSFSFSKEPVSKGFTILENPVLFDEPINGILRNSSALEWPKATVDWTSGSDTIKYIGLYYRKENINFAINNKYDYELVAVLPLLPEETIKKGEKVTLNANAIEIKLSNR